MTNLESSILNCPWSEKCSGCQHLGIPLSEQLRAKTERLTRALTAAGVSPVNVEVLSVGPSAQRTRLDFTLENGRLGLYARDREGITDLPTCAHLTPELQQWLTEFREHLPALSRASIRLRVGPTGLRGIWIDTANLAIKELLDEETWLRSWPADVVVELGQKRKLVRRDPGQPLKLVDPEYHPWAQSSYRGSTVNLWGSVGDFTQPGLVYNREILRWFESRLRALSPSSVIEFGSGNGNLSYSVLGYSTQLLCCEFDSKLTAGFAHGLKENSRTLGEDLTGRVRVIEGDHQRREFELPAADVIVANPPRSGLQRFAGTAAQAPNVLYMSCYLDSFIEDARVFAQKGLRITELAILDQFPQTDHFEILSRWKKS